MTVNSASLHNYLKWCSTLDLNANIGKSTVMCSYTMGWMHIDFHDTGRGPRIPAMTDRFGFTMASLNENGSVFANICNEKNMSTLMYRPFKSWANNSEWSMRFEEEEVRAVVLGSSWVAAVTSLNFLRIFTEGGLQRHVVSLDGPVVTASGFGDELAVVTHSSPNLPSNEQQMLEFSVFNVPNGTETIRGRLPLTPGSFLTWFGFSEEGQLTSFDSMGFLRAFTKQYGGRWLPLFSASKLKKNEENYWMVGLNSSKLFCILCKSPDKFPQVYPSVVPDVCSEGPLILFGQYRGGFPETLKVRGVRADMSSFTIDLKVQRPKDIPLDKVLAKQQIEQYTTQAWFSQDKKLEEKVAKLSMQMS